MDDPLDAVAVHGAGGLVGLISVPWFMYVGLEAGQRGIFWDGHESYPWLVLGYQIGGALAIATWSMLWSGIIFGSLNMLKILRVSDSDEYIGMDVIKHGESAYPVTAWAEYQYSKTNKMKQMIGTQMSMFNIMGMNKEEPAPAPMMNGGSKDEEQGTDNQSYSEEKL